MANTIKVRRSGVSGRAPTTSDLAIGELGLNYADAKLYCKKVVNGVESIAELSGGAGSGGDAFFADWGLVNEAVSTTWDFGGLG